MKYVVDQGVLLVGDVHDVELRKGSTQAPSDFGLSRNRPGKLRASSEQGLE
jgi:uncharacterized protein (DUF1499 family)